LALHIRLRGELFHGLAELLTGLLDLLPQLLLIAGSRSAAAVCSLADCFPAAGLPALLLVFIAVPFA